jgi:hypothetical protein
MKKIVIFLIALLVFEKAHSQTTDNPIFEKGQIILLGSPIKSIGKNKLRDTTIFKFIHTFYCNQKEEFTKSTFIPNEINDYVKNSTDPNIFQSWLHSFPSKKFLIDSVVNLDGKQYLVCHWIDNRGLLYSPESNINNDFPINSYFINSPQDALASGEIMLTKETYLEPYLLSEPTRAVQLFVERTSEVTFSLITLVLATLYFLLIRIATYRNFQAETLNGKVVNIPQSEYIKNDRTKQWIVALEHLDPRLVEIYYDFYKDYSLLQKGDLETLKKYRLQDVSKFNMLTAAIKKVQKKDAKLNDYGGVVSPQVGRMWDDLSDTINNNTAKQYKWMKSKGYSTASLEPFMEKYGISTDDKTAGLGLNMAEFVLEVQTILTLKK